MALPPHIVPQRTPADCAVAALATLMRWPYERAHTVLGPYATVAGTFLQSASVPLLRAGIAGTYLMARGHPGFDATMAKHPDLRTFPTSAEIQALLAGRRAILAIDHPLVFCAETSRSHAIVWDRDRAIECGATGDVTREPSEVDLTEHRILEALVLSEAPVAQSGPVEVRPPTALDGTDPDALAAIFDRHDRVFLGFSGGKESVALGHLLSPWQDRITLLWVNTGIMAPHMVEFVRGYRDEGWALEELRSPDVLEHWAAMGTPAEVFPQANVMGLAEPRLQPWAHCCRTIRQEPANAFLREQARTVAYINGQRRDDPGGATVAGLSSNLPPTVEVVQPLAGWTEADVLSYVERHGLTLPSQYAEGYRDSIECIACPAPLKAERLAYLARHYPQIVPLVVDKAREAANATMNALIPIAHLTAQGFGLLETTTTTEDQS